MNSIVKTQNITKKFGNKIAVNNVSINIEHGDIYGFIGRNGAGKTTTMKMLLGMSFPTSGEIELFGSKELNSARHRIGSLIEAPGLYKKCTAYENMKRFSILTGSTDKEINDLLRFVGLENVGSKKAGAFSLGMKQRLGIAIAMLGSPELLVLDEPTNGLDPAGIKEIRDLILKLNKERNITVFVSSHHLDELSKIVTKYGIINQGSLVEEVSSEELNSRCRECLYVKTNDLQTAHRLLINNFTDIEAEIKDDKIEIYSGYQSSDQIASVIVKNNIPLYELAYVKGSLEEYFIERIG